MSVFVCYLPLLFVPHKKKFLPPFQIDSCSLFEAALGVDGDCPGLVIGLRLLLVRQQARFFVCVLLFPPTILTSLFFPFFSTNISGVTTISAEEPQLFSS